MLKMNDPVYGISDTNEIFEDILHINNNLILDQTT